MLQEKGAASMDVVRGDNVGVLGNGKQCGSSTGRKGRCDMR